MFRAQISAKLETPKSVKKEQDILVLGLNFANVSGSGLGASSETLKPGKT